MSDHHPAPHPSTTTEPAAGRWSVVAAVAVPLAVLSIDFGGASVALPSIGEDLDVAAGSLGWVLNAFALGAAAPLVVAGRVADLIGRRRVLVVGLVLFTAATVVCGIAPTYPVLVAGRAAQGVATALFMTSSLGVLGAAFTEPFRTRAIGVWSAAGGVALAAGPLLGGLTTGLASWRWFFFINVPVLVAGIVLTLRVVPESRAPDARGVDPLGAVAVTAGTALATFAFQEGGSRGWSDPAVVASAAVAVPCVAAFVWRERQAAAPLIPQGLRRAAGYWPAVVVALLANWGFGAANLLLTLYLQDIAGWSPVAAGAAFLAYSVPFAAVGFAIGRIVARVGVRGPATAGMVGIAAAFVVVGSIQGGDGALLVIVALAIAGVGQGLAYNLTTTAAMGTAPESVAASASGVLATVRNLGLVLGVTASTMVARDLAGEMPSTVVAGTVAPDAVADAFADGMRGAAALVVVVSLVGAAVAWRRLSPATPGPAPASGGSASAP